MARDHEGKRDRWIEMRSTDMPKCVDHGGDDETKNETHTKMRNLTLREGINHYGSTSCKDKTKGADALRDTRHPDSWLNTMGNRPTSGAIHYFLQLYLHQ